MVESDRRVIHQTRRLGAGWKPGRPILCDFGEARLLWPNPRHFTDDKKQISDGMWWKTGKTQLHMQTIQPVQYRAPEVMFQLEWGEKVDIWNLGVMVSNLPTNSAISSFFFWLELF